MCPLEDTLAATYYRSFLSPGGIPDSTDFLYKLLGKGTFFLTHYGAATLLLRPGHMLVAVDCK